LNQSQEPLVFQSCVEVDELNTVMDGYLTFRYLRPGEVPNEEPENVQDVEPALLFRVDVTPFQLRLQPGQAFFKNPNFQPGMN